MYPLNVYHDFYDTAVIVILLKLVGTAGPFY